MPVPLINTSEALDLAIQVSRQIRRERLLKASRSYRLRLGILYSLAACVSAFSVTAFIYGDVDAGTVIIFMAFGMLFFAYIAGKTTQKRLTDALREFDQAS